MHIRRTLTTTATLAAIFSSLQLATAAGDNADQLVHMSSAGKLSYTPYDTQSDHLPDFSNCGYMGGGVKLPDLPIALKLTPSGASDDTPRIQAALDKIAAAQPDKNGFRGTLLLARGKFTIGTLKISASGIVLRGSGDSDSGTILIAAGNKQHNAIQILGSAKLQPIENSAQKITAPYVPVGSHTIPVENASSFKPGDSVMVRRIGNDDWIHELKMDEIPQKKAGTKEWPAFNMDADRIVTAVSANAITVDAPICCAIDAKWGGGSVFKYTDPGRIQNCGIENLRIVSTYDASVTEKRGPDSYPADENHGWVAIQFSTSKNCWARNITSVYFGYALAQVGSDCKWITVQDSECLEPVSVITGGRRYSFDITGQLSLMQRCHADKGRHSFVMNGTHLPGPDVFLDCTATHEFADSGPHQRWSTGTLWDNVKSVLHTQDREDMGSGHGWAGANDVYWNCQGEIVIQQPPTAQNFAIGFVGNKGKPAFAKLDHPDGYYASFGQHVAPQSLYLAQLKDRLGPQALTNIAPPK